MVKENYKRINNLLSDYSEYIKKIQTEKINNNWIIDVSLNNKTLHLFVSDKIKVDLDNSLNKHFLDFNRNERVFENYLLFEEFFLNIIDNFKHKTEGLYIEYQGEEYLCEVEVTHIDPDRQMGTETIYEVYLTDQNGDHIIVADVAEYPYGSFSVYSQNPEFEQYYGEIENYFQSKMIE